MASAKLLLSISHRHLGSSEYRRATCGLELIAHSYVLALGCLWAGDGAFLRAFPEGSEGERRILSETRFSCWNWRSPCTSCSIMTSCLQDKRWRVVKKQLKRVRKHFEDVSLNDSNNGQGGRYSYPSVDDSLLYRLPTWNAGWQLGNHSISDSFSNRWTWKAWIQRCLTNLLSCQ